MVQKRKDCLTKYFPEKKWIWSGRKKIVLLVREGGELHRDPRVPCACRLSRAKSGTSVLILRTRILAADLHKRILKLQLHVTGKRRFDLNRTILIREA